MNKQGFALVSSLTTLRCPQWVEIGRYARSSFGWKLTLSWQPRS